MRTTLFSVKAEYACIAMLELAARHSDPQPVRLKAIADAHGLKPRFLVQILLQLKGAGLVLTTRGASGGYHLARPPEQIALAEVLNVIDRPERAAAGRAAAPPSALVQALRGVWREIQDAQRRILESTTLAELVRRSQENYELTYQI